MAPRRPPRERPAPVAPGPVNEVADLRARVAVQEEQMRRQTDILEQLLRNADRGVAPPVEQAEEAPRGRGRPPRREDVPQANAQRGLERELPRIVTDDDIVLAPLVDERVYERFRRQDPPRFAGGMEMAVADNEIGPDILLFTPY